MGPKNDSLDSFSKIYGFFGNTVPSLQVLAKSAIPYGITLPEHLQDIESTESECVLM